MRLLVFILVGGLFCGNARGQALVSDSFFVPHYTLSLNTDFTNSQLQGCCAVHYTARLNQLHQLPLLLEQLQVDSVKSNATLLSYSYHTPFLRITLPSLLNAGDSGCCFVYYHGHPVIDSSNWGGFYFNGNYAYNLGVGFAAHPHNFGRAWFPCIDDFPTHSTYNFSITVPAGRMAVCNGFLTQHLVNGNNTDTWNWEMDSLITSYLACVAIADYTPVYQQVLSINGMQVPVQLTARASDTANMKNFLIHLPAAFHGFEEDFGPYRWNKVGYSFIPFSSGAMEHASNISIPQAWIAGGALTYEQYAYHELSHHWFGDLVTCKTAEDMWLNEGWATYCQNIFMENVYGRTAYDNGVAANHEQVLHFDHVNDAGYRAVSGVPHDYTYGNTVYMGGADVAHTLRGYLGDSLFFHCMSAYLNTYAHQNATSIMLRDFLSSCSGIDLHSFFDDWVFQPGFPDFSIDSVAVVPNGGNYDLTVFIRQKLSNAPQYFQNVPLELTFWNSDFTSVTQKVWVSGACTQYSTTLGFNPAFTDLNERNLISDATTDDLKIIKQAGNVSFSNGKMSLTVGAVADSVLLRITHHYAYADRLHHPVPGLHVSSERYWTVDGIIPPGFSASAILSYNGMNSGSGYLDSRLMEFSMPEIEDSLVVLYRPSAGCDWSIDTTVTQSFAGSHTNKAGSFTLTHLKKGQYTLGLWDHAQPDTLIAEPLSCLGTGISALPGGSAPQIKVYPNPAGNNLHISLDPLVHDSGTLEIMDDLGRRVYSTTLRKDEGSSGQIDLNTGNWKRGLYFIRFHPGNSSRVQATRFILQ